VISNAAKSGLVLHGNDFDLERIKTWYDDEDGGCYQIDLEQQTQAGGYSYTALNRLLGRLLRPGKFDLCVSLGPGPGNDVLSLERTLGRIHAIEISEEYWGADIGGIPTDWRKPKLDGSIDLPDNSADLFVAMGVLHHIPNVEQVIGEIARVLKPGGELIMRDPISSMGDWTVPRRGHTKNERGIPPALMKQFLAGAGLRIRHLEYLGSGLPQALIKLGLTQRPYRSTIVSQLDRVASSLLAWNARYWRPRMIDKLAPNAAAYIAVKP